MMISYLVTLKMTLDPVHSSPPSQWNWDGLLLPGETVETIKCEEVATHDSETA